MSTIPPRYRPDPLHRANTWTAQQTFNGGIVLGDDTLIRQLLRRRDSFLWWSPGDIAAFLDGQVVTGSGSTTVGSRLIDLTTGTTATSTAMRRNTTAAQGWSRGKGRQVLDWSKRVAVVMHLSLCSIAEGAIARYLFGPSTTDGVQALDDKGVGIEIDRSGANVRLWTTTHDGTTLSTTNTGQDLGTAGIGRVAAIVSDGAGNVEWFLDGTSVGTDTGGPTGDSTNDHAGFNVQVDNQGLAIVARTVLNDLMIGVEQ